MCREPNLMSSEEDENRGLCIMIAASIYTDIFHKNESNGWYGPSYIIAWVAFALTFISCVIYFVLRKKTT